ncbi:uncharacterized protein DEA37_0008197 [Paragonimus westermani]|uniref:Uncharacterized protein n=1 Tax=Paragonimus westermani TaxID=34504 RepID=A0A5J4NX44_9TREM|nr:uncharacterized protein DEA37_0008197 [Paragonimus westermani]
MRLGLKVYLRFLFLLGLLGWITFKLIEKSTPLFTRISLERLADEQDRLIKLLLYQHTSVMGTRLTMNCTVNSELAKILRRLSTFYKVQDSKIELLRSSTFGLVLSTNRLIADDSGPAVFSWQLQLLFCLQAGTIPLVVGEGPFPYPKAISADTWEQAIIRINLRHTEQLIRQINAISLAQLARLRYNGELIFQRHFRDDGTHLSTLLLEVSRRYGFTQPVAPSWSTMLVKELHSHNVTYPMFSQNERQDLDCQLNGERRVCSVDLLPRQIAMGSSDLLKMNPFWTYPSTPWDTIVDEVNKNRKWLQ